MAKASYGWLPLQLHCNFEKEKETFCPLACMSNEYVANELLFPV
jgi:hypothetical protein